MIHSILFLHEDKTAAAMVARFMKFKNDVWTSNNNIHCLYEGIFTSKSTLKTMHTVMIMKVIIIMESGTCGIMYVPMV